MTQENKMQNDEALKALEDWEYILSELGFNMSLDENAVARLDKFLRTKLTAQSPAPSVSGEVIEGAKQALALLESHKPQAVERVTQEQFNETIKKYAHINFPARTVMCIYPNGVIVEGEK